MSSGKSEQLIRLLKRVIIAQRNVLVFKPMRDTRTDACTIASRDGKRHEAVAVADPVDILRRVEEAGEVSAVGVDEIHFFDASLVHVAEELVKRGKRVFMAGLDTDSRGMPFATVANLMAISDVADKQTAICMRCGAPANRSQRLIDGQPAPFNAPTLAVGGDEMHEARCRSCHVVNR